MGAGILPITLHKDELYLLFSKEYSNDKDFVDWRDFGGRKEKSETPKETAIREGWEESSGFLGGKEDIRNLIEDNLVYKVHDKYYTIFIVFIDYDFSLPSKFRRHFLKTYNKDRSKICKNGFYEKSHLRWIKVSELKENLNMFLPWYQYFVSKIYNKFK